MINSNYSKDFELFWKAYPNKKAKGNAWKWWKRYKPNKADLIIILNALEKQKIDRKCAGSRFYPDWKLPISWLNGECWLDETKFIKSSEVKCTGCDKMGDWPILVGNQPFCTKKCRVKILGW